MNAAGPLWIVASVVIIAGAWKAAQPAPAATAVRALVPATRRFGLLPAAVRALGAAEVAVGAAAVWFGGRVAPAVLAALFAAFTGVAVRLRGKAISCGCFGAAAARTTWLHVVLDALCAIATAIAAAAGPPGLADAAPALPYAGVAHLVLVPAGAAAVVALLTVVPATGAPATAPSAPVTFRWRSER